MPYLRKNNREIENGKKKTLAVVLILFILILWSNKYHDYLTYKSSKITSMIKISMEETAQKIYSFFYIFYSKEKLAKENNELKEQIKTLWNENYLLNKNYNVRLKELEIANKDKSPNDVIGFITSKAPAMPFGYAMIDLGIKDGIKTGDLAIYQNFLVGKIAYVSNEHSMIKFFGFEKKDEKLMIGENKIIKTAIGQGNGNFLFDLPKNTQIKEGQVVRIAEFSKYIFGETVSAGVLGNSDNKTLYAQSPVNYLEIPFVTIKK